MRALHVSVALLLVLSLTAFSCTKRKDKGGKGGAATLKASPKHHSAYIYDCTIYLKYDSSVPPSDSTTGYDEQVAVTVEDGKPVATFTGLKNGKYYLYGYGYDTSIAQNVKGGIPFEITDQGTTTVNVPVTEGD
jgi:hypothetical protein